VPHADVVRACHEIGYKGYFAYEVCTPFAADSRPPEIEDVDRMVAQGTAWLRGPRDNIVSVER